ncbi:MAG: alpha/beta fold hydrolase [Gammaproteobacteria bacterium]|nr:alpha/beta fold hydrolase [Gammaproteobacteria bacterium]
MDSPVMQLRALRDNEFAIQVSGDGIPLIWGHCLLGCMEADDAAAILDFAQLSRRARLIRFDARGHGESSGSDNPRDYRWDKQAEDVWAIAELYAPGEKVILGGASMGSATALHAAIKHPEKVAGLILVLPPTGWRTRPRQAVLYRRLAGVIGWLSAASKLALNLLRLDPHGKPLRRALTLAVSEHISQAHPPWLRAALLGAAQSDLPDLRELQRLEIPTAILTWEDDSAHPVSTAATLQSVLPDVRVYQVSSTADAGNWTAYIEDMLRGL